MPLQSLGRHCRLDAESVQVRNSDWHPAFAKLDVGFTQFRAALNAPAER